MTYDGEAIVSIEGRLSLILRAILLLMGIVAFVLPIFMLGRGFLGPETPFVPLLIGVGVLLGFAIAGMMTLSYAVGPSHQMRFDPATGMATITRHYPFRIKTSSLPLSALGVPWIENVPQSEGDNDFALHMSLPDGKRVSLWSIPTEAKAEALRLRLLAMIEAARQDGRCV